MTPEALRRRMAHGNVYGSDKIETALGNYFRVGNLTALRELALLWLADKVDDQLDRYRADHGIGTTWEARERVVVGLTGGPEGDTLIRRAARIAARTKGADLLAVHIARSDGLSGADPALLARQRLLLESLGGTYHEVLGSDITTALLDFARGRQRHPARSRGKPPRPGRPDPVRRSRGEHHRPIRADRRAPGHPRTNRAGTAAAASRRIAGPVGAAPDRRFRARPASACPSLTLILLGLDQALSLPSDILLFLALVVAVALVGGSVAGAAGRRRRLAAAELLLHPTGQRLDHRRAGQLVGAGGVCGDRGRRQCRGRHGRPTDPASRQSERGGLHPGRGRGKCAPRRAGPHRPARAAPRNAGPAKRSPCSNAAPMPAAPPSTADATRTRGGSPPRVGGDPCESPSEGEVEVPIAGADEQGTTTEVFTLVLRGHPLAADDRRIVEAFAAQAVVALRQERLVEEAEAARPLAEADRMRTALLAAVSHDLRGPLASAKAASHQPAERRGHLLRRGPGTNCLRPPTNRSTGSLGSSRTCST